MQENKVAELWGVGVAFRSQVENVSLECWFAFVFFKPLSLQTENQLSREKKFLPPFCLLC